jgi:hypothetical protein
MAKEPKKPSTPKPTEAPEPKVEPTKPVWPKMKVVGPDKVIFQNKKGKFVKAPTKLFKLPKPERDEQGRFVKDVKGSSTDENLKKVSKTLANVLKESRVAAEKSTSLSKRQREFNSKILHELRDQAKVVNAVQRDVLKLDRKTSSIIDYAKKQALALKTMQSTLTEVQETQNAIAANIVSQEEAGGSGGKAADPTDPSSSNTPKKGGLRSFLTGGGASSVAKLVGPVVATGAAITAAVVSGTGTKDPTRALKSLEESDAIGAPTSLPTRTGEAPNYSKGKAETGTTQRAMKHFIDDGYTPQQSAGIVGNLVVESGLRTNIPGDGGVAYGIAQWHPDRQRNFQQVFGKSIKESSFDEQLQFVSHELKTTHAGAGKAIRASKTEAQAAAVTDAAYEISAGIHRRERIAQAKGIYKAYQKTDGQKDEDTDGKKTETASNTPVPSDNVDPEAVKDIKQGISDELKTKSGDATPTETPASTKMADATPAQAPATGTESPRMALVSSLSADDGSESENPMLGKILKAVEGRTKVNPKSGLVSTYPDITNPRGLATNDQRMAVPTGGQMVRNRPEGLGSSFAGMLSSAVQALTGRSPDRMAYQASPQIGSNLGRSRFSNDQNSMTMAGIVPSMTGSMAPNVQGMMQDQVGRYPDRMMNPRMQDRSQTLNSGVYNIIVPTVSQPSEPPPERYERNRVPSAMPSRELLASLFELRTGSEPVDYAFGR